MYRRAPSRALSPRPDPHLIWAPMELRWAARGLCRSLCGHCLVPGHARPSLGVTEPRAGGSLPSPFCGSRSVLLPLKSEGLW